MEKELRKTGIDLIGNALWGTHFCQFYQTQEDLIDILVPYFKAGLENNEFCMWITAEPLTAKKAKASLKKTVRNLDDYIEKGQIEILDYGQWYTKSGKFDVDEVLDGWVEKENQALERGFDGLRLTGNTFWLEDKDWKGFTEYEKMVNDVIGNYKMLAVCSYSLDKCGAAEIMDVVTNHKFALVKRENRWEIIESYERKQAEEALRRSEEKLWLALDATTDGIWQWNFMTNELDFSSRYYTMLGYEPDEFPPSFESWQNLIHPDDLQSALGVVEEYLKTKPDEYENEFRLKTKGGGYRWMRAKARVVERSQDGNALFMIVNHEDITERKRAEEVLQDAKEFSDSLISSMQDGLSVLDSHGVHMDVNPAFCQMTGFSREELIGIGASHPYWPPEAYEEIERVFQKTLRGEFGSFELTFMRKNGERFPVIVSPSWIKDKQGNVISYVTTVKDITRRKKVEKQIQKAFREKEILLREIHHRVKNNLQVISSLLDLASMRTYDQKAISLFTDAKSKIQTMALIHSHVYQSETLDKIDMGSHLRELVSFLSAVYAESKIVTPIFEISNIYLSITQAIPCALVCNELISNALKHAFGKENKGIIEISMQKSDQDTIYIRIRDNGASISEEIDIYETETLGLKLVRNIVQKQLNGKIQLKRNKGTEFIIEFKVLKKESGPV